ncbi:MAG: MBOAT family O-acyltransferase [Erysipelotrichaceae bacterium]|nr:MBOAT family O-acyltransferase [Erysipelotrichaceae bacterium]
MLFSSLTFLLAFLPLVLVLYYINNNRVYRNIILLISSLIFYSWGEPRTIIIIMIITIVVNYFMAIMIEENEKYRKLLFIVTCIFNIGILFFFKYFNFFVNDVLMLKNVTLNIILPIGISFYTFQILSYVIDVYKKEVVAQRSIINLGAYVTMFPQLIAGPIVRYQTIAKELTERKEHVDDIAEGLRRFIIGLGKKIIIANQMAIIADKVYLSIPLHDLNTMFAWIGTIAFALQIYYDFSGYSDMAIGLGKMFGFHFVENFNYPYIATSITDFWRRWHISLSSWFRDYVYIPLGGSRCSKARWMLNIMIVWSLTGLWHGASYNFILWGLYYGVLLMMEKLFFKKYLDKLKGINYIITMLIVLVGWVFFNSSSVDQIIYMIRNLFGFNGSFSLILLNNQGILYLLPYMLIAIIGMGPWINQLFIKIRNNTIGFTIYDIYLVVILVVCLIFLINNSYNPFIYFRF